MCWVAQHLFLNIDSKNRFGHIIMWVKSVRLIMSLLVQSRQDNGNWLIWRPANTVIIWLEQGCYSSWDLTLSKQSVTVRMSRHYLERRTISSAPARQLRSKTQINQTTPSFLTLWDHLAPNSFSCWYSKKPLLDIMLSATSVIVSCYQ